jgi:hypothetical protein
MKEDLRKLFIRDLGKLEKEINAYRHESSLWLLDKEILNSAGNLSYPWGIGLYQRSRSRVQHTAPLQSGLEPRNRIH